MSRMDLVCYNDLRIESDRIVVFGGQREQKEVDMLTVNVNISLPRDLLGALDVPEVRVEGRLRELIALELVREGRISTGKGAEMVGISKWAFIQLLAQRGIDYFTETPDELAGQVAELQRLLPAEPA
jgi:predicted HTH domain antitoxin